MNLFYQSSIFIAFILSVQANLDASTVVAVHIRGNAFKITKESEDVKQRVISAAPSYNSEDVKQRVISAAPSYNSEDVKQRVISSAPSYNCDPIKGPCTCLEKCCHSIMTKYSCNKCLVKFEKVCAMGNDKCLDIPGACNGHGVCHGTPNKKCWCLKGWEGELCSNATCEILGCGEHGQCDPSTNLCICKKGFGGNFCEKPDDLCFNKDCGRGFCSKNSGLCICENGFSGDHCQIDACENINCGENGKCVPSGRVSVACQCKSNWAGTYCDRCDSHWQGENCDHCARIYEDVSNEENNPYWEGDRCEICPNFHVCDCLHRRRLNEFDKCLLRNNRKCECDENCESGFCKGSLCNNTFGVIKTGVCRERS